MCVLIGIENFVSSIRAVRLYSRRRRKLVYARFKEKRNRNEIVPYNVTRGISPSWRVFLHVLLPVVPTGKGGGF